MQSQMQAAGTESPTCPAKLLTTLKGHTDTVSALAFTADRCLLASAGRDSSGRVWDIGSSKPGERGSFRKFGETFRSLACSPSGRLLAAGSSSLGGYVWLFDLTEKAPQETATLRGARSAVEAIAFSPDGKQIAAGGEDCTLRIWEPGPGFKGDPRTLLIGHTKTITTIAFSPDGHSLASGAQDSTVRLWTLSRIRSSQRALLQHPADVTSVAYLRDGKTLATGCRDGFVRLWDTTAIKPTVLRQIAGPAGGIRLLLAPDYDLLIGVGDGTRVMNWDPRSGSLLREWEVPGDPAFGVALTGDGRYLARGTGHGPVELYRVAEKRT